MMAQETTDVSHYILNTRRIARNG